MNARNRVRRYRFSVKLNRHLDVLKPLKKERKKKKEKKKKKNKKKNEGRLDVQPITDTKKVIMLNSG